MVKFDGTVSNIRNYMYDGYWELTIRTRDIDAIAELNDKRYPLSFAAKKKVEKRSLDMNAYAWVLIDKIASTTHERKSLVYQRIIQDTGGVCDEHLIKEECVPSHCKFWDSLGLGFTTQVVDSTLPGWKRVIEYYGSSTYDKNQMKVFIESIKQECESLDIPTYDERRLEQMLEEWGEYYTG